MGPGGREWIFIEHLLCPKHQKNVNLFIGCILKIIWGTSFIYKLQMRLRKINYLSQCHRGNNWQSWDSFWSLILKRKVFFCLLIVNIDSWIMLRL